MQVCLWKVIANGAELISPSVLGEHSLSSIHPKLNLCHLVTLWARFLLLVYSHFPIQPLQDQWMKLGSSSVFCHALDIHIRIAHIFCFIILSWIYALYFLPAVQTCSILSWLELNVLGPPIIHVVHMIFDDGPSCLVITCSWSRVSPTYLSR